MKSLRNVQLLAHLASTYTKRKIEFLVHDNIELHIMHWQYFKLTSLLSLLIKSELRAILLNTFCF